MDGFNVEKLNKDRIMIYYTSDLHFFHFNILRICNRPFSSLEEMHEALINNWNKKVRPEDTVYILGDLSYKCQDITDLYKILKRLNGHKILVQGNHDHKWLKIFKNTYPKEIKEIFEEITFYKEILDGSKQVALFHYPIEDYNHQYHGGYHLFGHIHNSGGVKKLEKRFNVGVDVNDFTPMTLDELIERNK